ncbi:hypothetical protein GQR58_007396 [Nymphon striatum]|nr:hypothetical protein GQR58_007396 [Nymphon striatum]
MLFVGKVLRRFLDDKNVPTESLGMKCLKPKVGSGTTLKDTPTHLPDISLVSLADVIAGLLEVSPFKGSAKFNIPNYEDIVEHYKFVCPAHFHLLLFTVWVKSLHPVCVLTQLLVVLSLQLTPMIFLSILCWALANFCNRVSVIAQVSDPYVNTDRTHWSYTFRFKQRGKEYIWCKYYLLRQYSSSSSAGESSTLMTTDDGAMSSSSTSNNDGVVFKCSGQTCNNTTPSLLDVDDEYIVPSSVVISVEDSPADDDDEY